MAIRRREFLQFSTLGGVLAAAGCCSTAPSIEMTAAAESLEAPVTPLAPRRINAALRLTNDAVDPHFHMFNASDIQAGGYLAGPVAQDLAGPLRWIVEQLAPIIENLAKRLAISAHAEWQMLDTLETTTRRDGLSAAHGTIDESIEFHEREAARALSEAISGDLLQRINERLTDPGAFRIRESATFGEDYLLEVFRKDREASTSTALRQATRDPMDGIFAFLKHMLMPRHLNLRQYQEAYTEKTLSVRISQCVAAMVDFDRWVGKCDQPYSLMKDQILLMARISQQSGGYMRPLVAYNPWTDIDNNDQSILLVEEALKSHGFVGVKIYPPIGYYPSNNNDGNYPKTGKRPNLELLDQKLCKLFEVCRGEDRPVMAHSNQSRGRDRNYNNLGSPAAWGKFFSEPINRGTRVNLGHIGGESSVTDKITWTRLFVDLMKKPSAINLYGDLGYWEQLANGDGDARRRLTNVLDIDVSGGQKASDRLMFGTDWFMISKENNWNEYVVGLQRSLQPHVSEEVLNNLFADNAKRLFRL